MLITLCRHYSILIRMEKQNHSHKIPYLSVCSPGAPDLLGQIAPPVVCDRGKHVAKSAQFACWNSGFGGLSPPFTCTRFA